MFAKLRLFTFFAAIIIVLSIGTYATDIIYPDSVTGEYSYSYDTGVANDEFVVIVLKGIYEQGDIPEISAESVLYYNVFTSDDSGVLEIKFVPLIYSDATVFIGGYDIADSVLVCHAMKDTAKDVADFTLTLSDPVVAVDGVNGGTIRFTVIAIDSFGFDTVLPDYTTYEIVGYTGDRITVSDNGTIFVDSMAQSGNYTLRVTCADLVREIDFTVQRAESVAKQMSLACNGNSWYAHYVDCVNTADGFSFDPVSCQITVTTYDQYGDVISGDYNFKYAEVYGNNITGSMTAFATGESAEFVPTEKVLPGEKDLQYKIQVSSVHNSELKQELLVVVQGKTVYTGKTLDLYENYLTAKNYIKMFDDGNIVVSENGLDVYYQNSWVNESSFLSFVAVTEDTSELFAKIDSVGVSSEEINNALSLLTKELSSFSRALRKGLYAPVEKIEFEAESIKIAVGDTLKPAVTVLPLRSTESVIYSSSNDTVASVSQTGIITAVSEGQAVITASNTQGNVYDTLSVRIYKPITNIAWEQNSINLVAGEAFTPKLEIAPETHSDIVTFSTSDTNVAAVEDDGTVTAVGPGEAIVSAKTLDNKTSVLKVTVSQPAINVPKIMKSKTGATFVLPIKIENSKGISALSIKAEFDQTKFDFVASEDTGVLETYLTSDVTAGEIISTWDVNDDTLNKSGEIVKYTFSVGENTPHGTYKVNFEFTATTSDGQSIVLKSASAQTDIVIGEDDKYNVTVQAGSGGTAQGSAQYSYGEKATVSALANDLFTFAGWYDGEEKVSNKATYTFDVTEDITLIARFSREVLGPIGIGDPASSDDGKDEPTVVSPVVSNVLSGSYVPYGSRIELSTATKDATIYYTLDGTTPSALSLQYTEPIIIESDLMIKAIAVKTGMTSSIVSTLTYLTGMTETVEVSLKEDADSVKYIVPVNNCVRPDEVATRYEVVEMLNKLFNVKGKTVASVKFTDLDSRFKLIIDKYSGAEIINGYPDGTFRGTNGITRAEVTKILYKMLGFDFSNVSGYAVSLTDIQNHWAKDYIKTCVTMGIFIGYPDGTFGPDKLVTRAEMITILNRITGITKVPGITSGVVTDVAKEHWAYDDIMNVIDVKNAIDRQQDVTDF